MLSGTPSALASVSSSVSSVASYDSTKKMVSMAWVPGSKVNGSSTGWPAVAETSAGRARLGATATACGSGMGRA